MTGTALLIASVFSISPATAQLSYSKGQNVSPAYEGWEKNDDGSFNMLFGYMNSNWEEEFDLPVSPDNKFEPGDADQGQPTHFFPRRNRFVFRVHVPKDFGEKDLIWTLTTHGKTLKAYGSLRQDYYLDNMVFTSETGAIGAGVSTPEIRANKPPVLEAAGDRVRTVKVGEALTLSAHVTDDGVPKESSSARQRRARIGRRRERSAHDSAAPGHRRQRDRIVGRLLSVSRRRGCDDRSSAAQDVGRYARRWKFAMVADLDPATRARRRQVDRDRKVRSSRHLHSALARFGRRAVGG